MKQKFLLFIISLLSFCFVNAQNNSSKDSDENKRLNTLYLKGYELYNQKKYSEAIKYFKEAAEENHALSQAYMGHCYYMGHGVNSDYPQSATWYTRAAENGNAHAQYKLALFYQDGIGVYRDHEKSAYWLQKAANQGFVSAQELLSSFYTIGRGVEKDPQKAFYWAKRAADQGDAGAIYNLGGFYLNGTGTQVDTAKAVKYYEDAASKGYSGASCKLAKFYYKGKILKRDYQKAFSLFKVAADENDFEALNYLGMCFLEGKGTGIDYKSAVEMFKKAIHKGDYKAFYNLGYCYIKGYGVKKNFDFAESLSKKAMEKVYSNPYPYRNLSLIYALRDDNYSEALRYSDLALTRLSDLDNEDKSVIYGDRALVYLMKGDIENAQKIESQCVKYNSNFLLENNDYIRMKKEYILPEKNGITVSNMDNNTFALIIGNEQYKEEASVEYAINDAKAVCDFFENNLGIPNKQIKYIENATYNDIRRAVNWLVQAMNFSQNKGRAIFYYAGHGIPNESDNSSYLLPYDGVGSDIESAYSLKTLYEKLGASNAKSIIVLLDACFSGSKRENAMLASARGVAIKAKPASPQGNMVVFSAAKGDETAYPYKEKKHGMFTYYLLNKLQESKGKITLGELGDYLQKEVSRQSFLENNKTQTPTVSASPSLGASWKDSFMVPTTIDKTSGFKLNNTISKKTVSPEEEALEKQLNTAWFVFGTKKELMDQKIILDDKLQPTLNKDYFTQVDIRKETSIKLYSKAAMILTPHSDNSFFLERDSNNQYVINIIDPEEFWSLSKYLVVRVR